MERGELDAARAIFERAIERWPHERTLRANLSRLSRMTRAKAAPSN
jgi:Flp pilus assembly protein TadD